MYVCSYQNEEDFLNVTYNDIINNGLNKNKCVVLKIDDTFAYLIKIYQKEATYEVLFSSSFKYDGEKYAFSAASPDDFLTYHAIIA